MQKMMLPPGQQARSDFPRFGLPQYKDRFPSNTQSKVLEISVDDRHIESLDLAISDLPRVSITADFHCVTTWSYVGARWEGVRLSDVYARYVLGSTSGQIAINGAAFYSQDGYKTSLLLEDLLADNVILADTLDGQPLPVEHGAPLRLIAPDHYGYKNPKHLSKIVFHTTLPVLKRGVRAFLDHPRARVAEEERGRWVPGKWLRLVYRPLIASTVKDFQAALSRYRTPR